MQITVEAGVYPPHYAQTPIAFWVTSVATVGEGGTLTTSPVPRYRKDYDALGHPDRWCAQWDVSRWLFLRAEAGGAVVGRAAVAMQTPGVDMLEGRDDLAVLWDLRVSPAARGRGVGRRLFVAAAAAARHRGCVVLKVETQDTNAAACGFYAAMGCRLSSVRPDAYADCPGEAQVIWRLGLLAGD